MPAKYVYIDDLAVNYLHAGQTTLPNVVPDLSRGHVVLFVHGAGGNAKLWQPYLDRLSARHSPLAIDLPGHGRSGGLEGLKAIDAYREFIKKFAELLSLRPFVFVGHSMGGAIALDLALHYPEKLCGLVLVATGARLRVAPQTLENLKKAMEGKIRLPFDRSAYSPHTSDEMVRMIERQRASTDVRVRYFNMKACDAFDVMDKINQIRIPALVLCGKDDVVTPVKYAEYLQKQIPHAQLVLIDKAGHWLPAEQFEPMVQALESFLDTL
jgi:pimeloyl-ACP methyl ester carboxylesterase